MDCLQLPHHGRILHADARLILSEAPAQPRRPATSKEPYQPANAPPKQPRVRPQPAVNQARIHWVKNRVVAAIMTLAGLVFRFSAIEHDRSPNRLQRIIRNGDDEILTLHAHPDRRYASIATCLDPSQKFILTYKTFPTFLSYTIFSLQRPTEILRPISAN